MSFLESVSSTQTFPRFCSRGINIFNQLTSVKDLLRVRTEEGMETLTIGRDRLWSGCSRPRKPTKPEECEQGSPLSELYRHNWSRSHGHLLERKTSRTKCMFAIPFSKSVYYVNAGLTGMFRVSGNTFITTKLGSFQLKHIFKQYDGSSCDKLINNLKLNQSF